MKELKFKTSKGEFLVVDDVEGIGKFIPYDLVTKIGYIKNLTEEQASEIVESHKNCKRYYYENTIPQKYNSSAVITLHSLLKSKGIHLFENPIEKPLKTQDIILCNYDWELEQWQEAEEETLYNPYIFKL